MIGEKICRKKAGKFHQKAKTGNDAQQTNSCWISNDMPIFPEIVRIVLAAGAPFVLTSHVNQDPLEQLFGHCRYKGGSNDNTNVAEASHAINSIRTVSRQAVSSARGNTAPCEHTLDTVPVPKRKTT